MSSYLEKALKNHEKGYNCAQAVLCAFCDKINYKEEDLFKISEGLGAGMGNRKCACGALSGAVVLAGIVSSSGSAEKITKGDTYKLAGKLVDTFEERVKAINCDEIKSNQNGMFPVSCNECIKIAVEAAEEILFNN